MFRMRDLRVGLKIAISPAAAVIGMLVITAAASIVFGQLRDDLSSFNRVVDSSRRIHGLEAQLTLTHAHLYRFTSFAANEQDAAALKRRSAESRDEMAALNRSAAAGGIDPALAKLLARYTKDAADVIDMADADAATALMLMINADEQFTKAIAMLTAAVAQSEATRVSTSDSAFAAIRQASSGFALGAFIVTGLVVLVAFLVSRSIVRPVVTLTGAMRRLAAQDLTIAIPGLGRGDEIGAMAGAVDVFKENALQMREMERQQAEAQARRASEDERVRDEAETAAAAQAAAMVVGSIGMGLERLAAGDLTFRLNAALPDDYEALRDDLNTAMSELQDLVSRIVENTSGIRSGTSEITRASDDLSRRTEQQAASLEETAAALDEITATVRKTAEGAIHARTVVAQTRADAEMSGQVMRQAVSAMSDIDTSSRQIGQIIGVIDEIAFQTNLLALNAGVEAARAGEAGRGFAVVASEVRALAQRSAQAASEIKTLISTSSRQVGAGVKLVGETGQALDRIVTQVGEITTVVAEIAASAQEQALGLAEINTAINHMDQVTQQNAAMVEESTAASHSLAHDASELAQLTERFEIGTRYADLPEPAGHQTRPVARRAAAPMIRAPVQARVA